MSATVSTPSALTARLAELLALFSGLGMVRIDARSVDGLAHDQHWLRPPFGDGLPMAVTQLLLDRLTLRLTPVSQLGGNLVDLPMVIALWQPSTEFQVEERRHVVLPTAKQAIRAALGRMPAPSVLVDAGPEVWAGWRLAEPILNTDRMRDVLTRVARHVGADGSRIRNLATLDVPIAGVVRNWNVSRKEHITILSVDAAAIYALDTLLSHLVEDPAHVQQ